jgi:hypothetical protein
LLEKIGVSPNYPGMALYRRRLPHDYETDQPVFLTWRLQTTAEFNETNPFVVKIVNPGKKTSYIFSHQPKSFDWRVRDAKRHRLKQAPLDVFALA